ncbi:MAG: putative response regulator [Myxococcaceae bacterium]|nr:putative response regulator [Myxococcaceae bacterium]
MQSERPGVGGGANSGRLGGARADYVASLGRKVADARSVLTTLEGDPTARGPRDELRRKLHALGAGARLLRFDAMSKALGEAEGTLDRMGEAGKATERELISLAKVLDDLPALAWGDPPANERGHDRVEANNGLPLTALVVGEEEIANALAEIPESPTAATFECEHTMDLKVALERAHVIAPDVIVLDGDIEGTAELTETLLDDPMTEPVPIVVLGRFTTPAQASRFVALGVAKTLPKPVDADLLHSTCEELVDQRAGRAVRVTLGEPTVEELGDRLAEEVRRALVESVDELGKSCRVPLGEGTEVLAALWGAIARVREVVTSRTGGSVRFAGHGPEGTIPLAPWLHPDLPGADRTRARGRGAAVDVRLEGRRVIVADDDPGVTWFIADLLRTSGCIVHEALDGVSALDLAYQLSPDLVVSDILMPGLDGFALSRLMKRDVILRDTPVILLSWKEDLLQRVRELGAGAAGYLRKESDARAIVARVREALWPRARVERRLRANGEVRGRLDGLAVRSLLELACQLRPMSRVSVRDASYLYEVEIRDGKPKRATRTDGDGSFQRGERVLGAMLGVGAGRFVGTPSDTEVDGELDGPLAKLIERHVALARGAAQVLCGARTMGVERVDLDVEAFDGYLRSTPDPARGLIEQLSRGASPRNMILDGGVEPMLLDELLSDLASRGAVRGVIGLGGDDLLSPAFEAALAVLQGEARPSAVVAPSARPSRPSVRAAPVSTPRPSLTAPFPSPLPPPDAMATQVAEQLAIEANAIDIEASTTPSSLADAVMRQLRERSSTPPPMVDARALKLRWSRPPIDGSAPSPSPSAELEAKPGTDVDTIYDARLTPSEPGILARRESLLDEDEDLPMLPGRLELETPKTPMTSVATKNVDIASIPMKKGRWMSLLGLTAIALAVAGGWHMRASHRAAASAAPVAAAEPTLEDLGIPPPPAETTLTSAPLEPSTNASADPSLSPATEPDTKLTTTPSTTQAGDAAVTTAP